MAPNLNSAEAGKWKMRKTETDNVTKFRSNSKSTEIINCISSDSTELESLHGYPIWTF